jgi:hypothetical protein
MLRSRRREPFPFLRVTSTRWSLSPEVCATVVVVGAAATGVLQYLTPASFDNAPKVNHLGIVHYATALFGRTWPGLGTTSFVWTFRVLLVAMWLGYAFMLHAMLARRRRYRWALPVVVATALGIALFFPPSLSADLYAYAGWGRMVVFHGGNPYVDTLANLAAMGDAAARMNPVPAPSNHGSIWVLIVSAVVWLVPTADPFWQIVVLKLVGGGALVIAALSARAVSMAADSATGDLSLLAVGLNPLLLIEGPGSGHNDMLMMALMLAGIALHAGGRSWLGYLLMGSSAAVKFVTASMIPLVIIRQLKGRRASQRWMPLALAAALSILPAAFGYGVLWRGAQTFEGVRTVYDQRVRANEEGRVEPASRSRIGGVALRALLLAALYAGLVVFVAGDTRADTLMWAWACFAVAVIWIAMPVIFSWYFAWPLAASLTSWAAVSRRVSLVCAILAAVMLLVYTVPLST